MYFLTTEISSERMNKRQELKERGRRCFTMWIFPSLFSWFKVIIRNSYNNFPLAALGWCIPKLQNDDADPRWVSETASCTRFWSCHLYCLHTIAYFWKFSQYHKNISSFYSLLSVWWYCHRKQVMGLYPMSWQKKKVPWDFWDFKRSCPSLLVLSVF